jgi:hypothetical protein
LQYSGDSPSGYARTDAHEATWDNPLAGDPGIRANASWMGIRWYLSGGGDLPNQQRAGLTGSVNYHFFPKRKLWVPYRIMATVFGLLPAVGIFVRYRRQRGLARERGICPRCGYDLRATPERCPECGSVPATAKVKA